MKLKPPPGVRAIRGPGGRIDVEASSGKTGADIQRHLYRKAQEYAGYLQFYDEARKVMGFAPDVHSKEGLMRMGQFYWPLMYKGVEGDIADAEAVDKYVTWLDGTPQCFRMTSMIEPDALINTMTARWCDQAFPVITMGEKYFAALAATDIPEEMVDDIEAPWKCFAIEVPSGMLFIWDGDEKKSVPITRIMVQRYFGTPTMIPSEVTPENQVPEWLWRWVVFSPTGQHMWRNGTGRHLMQSVTFREHEVRHYYDPEREEAFADQLSHDERLFALIGKLILNVCMAMSDPDNKKSVGSSHARYEKRASQGGGYTPSFTGAPEQRVFQLGKPVTVDCRRALQDYLQGRKGAEKEFEVRWWVRGHWRWQVHGHKHTLRRRQWLPPFQKGPEGAPLLVRPHNLRGPEEES